MKKIEEHLSILMKFCFISFCNWTKSFATHEIWRYLIEWSSWRKLTMLDNNNHDSLFFRALTKTTEEKKFYKIFTCGQFHKTFFQRNSCPQQHNLCQKVWKYADSGLNNAEKSFMKLSPGRIFSLFWPWVIVIKLFFFVTDGTTKQASSLSLASCSGVNFTNILRAAFSHENFLNSFSVLTIWVCNFLAKGFWRKSCSYNVGEIDTILQ